MKLTLKQKVYETWLIREKTLSSISKTSLGLFTIPSISFFNMLVNGHKADFIALLALISIVSLRAFLSGLIAKTQFRLELAKKAMEEDMAP